MWTLMLFNQFEYIITHLKTMHMQKQKLKKKTNQFIKCALRNRNHSLMPSIK